MLFGLTRPALALCSSPAGNAGDIMYSSTQGVMAYCNGSGWINMGTSSTTSFGSLITNDFCTATSGSSLACTTASTGTGNVVLSASPTLTGTVTAGSSTWSGQIAIGTTTLSGAVNVSGTVNATLFSGSGASLTGIGTANLGGITGTPSSTTYLRGDGTWAAVAAGLTVASTAIAGGATTRILYDNAGVLGEYVITGTGNVVMSASPTLTGTVTATAANFSGNVGVGTTAATATLTVNGTHAFQYGTDYSTATATQSDVALNTYSAVRYTGAGSTVFYGIVAGVPGQVLYLTNAATSTNTLTLANQSASEATAGNKIITGTGADLVIANNSTVILQYDGAASRWRVIGGSGGGALATLTDVTLTSPVSGNLLSYNGSKWVNSTVSSAVTAAVAPSFGVYRSASQTVTANAWTKIQFDTKSFDTNSNFDVTTNNRYTPTIAGKYLVTLNVSCVNPATYCMGQVYKNGSSISYNRSNSPSGGGDLSAPVTAIVDMNGTTDYLEGYVYTGVTSLNVGAIYTSMSGALLAPLASGSVAGTGTANYIAKWTSSTNLSSSLLFDNGSAVGINTATPSSTLTVNGTESLLLGTDYTVTGSQQDVAINTASAVRYNGASAATFYGIVAGQSGQILLLHNASSSTLTLANQSASEATAANKIITGSGADLALVANSSVTLQYDNSASRWRVIGGSGGATPAGTTGQVQYNSGSNTLAANSNLTYLSANAQLVVGTGAATPLGIGTTGTVAGVIHNVIPTNFSFSSLSGTSSAVAAGATGQMAYYSGANGISGTPNLYVSGSNIGIGTSSATNLLSLVGQSAQTLWMERDYTASTAGNNLTVQAGGATSAASNKNGGNLILSGGVSTGTGTSSIQLQTFPGTAGSTSDNSAATAMTITGSGNVGIGTTLPTTKLSLQASSLSGTNSTGLQLTGDTLDMRLFAETATVGAGYVGTESAHSLRFYTGGPFSTNTRMTILSGGNIGIGTTGATAPLAVNSSWAASTTPAQISAVSSGSSSGASGIAGIAFQAAGMTAAAPWMLYAYPTGFTSNKLCMGVNGVSEPFCVASGGNATLAGTLTQNSDARLKTNVVTITNALERIQRVRGVNFNWKDAAKPKTLQIGVIAQELEKAFPEAVETDERGFKSVNYCGLVAPVFEAMKELKALFDGDHEELARLKTDDDKIRAANDNQAAEINRLREAEASLRRSERALTARLDKLEAARR